MKSTPKMNVISKMKMTPKIKTTLMKIIFLREREIERERERGLFSNSDPISNNSLLTIIAICWHKLLLCKYTIKKM